MCLRYIAAALVLSLVGSATAVAAQPIRFVSAHDDLPGSESDSFLTQNAILNAVADGLREAGLRFDSKSNIGVELDYHQLYLSDLPKNTQLRVIAASLELIVPGTALGKKGKVGLCPYGMTSYRVTNDVPSAAQAAELLAGLKSGAKEWATNNCPYLK